MGESLKQKTVKGTFWSAVDGISNQGITFLVGLVLARILTPEEYGILATIMIFIAIANSLNILHTNLENKPYPVILSPHHGQSSADGMPSLPEASNLLEPDRNPCLSIQHILHRP